MLIEELEDMLVLVGDLPRDWQWKCAQAICSHVEEWEARQQEPHLSDEEWRELQSQRAVGRYLHDEIGEMQECGMDVETRSGVVETFDCNERYGYIRMEDGERALLHVTCLRGCGYRQASEGASVEFLALRGSGGWQAYRILALAPPDDLRGRC